jgi:hypothetical protein
LGSGVQRIPGNRQIGLGLEIYPNGRGEIMI